MLRGKDSIWTDMPPAGTGRPPRPSDLTARATAIGHLEPGGELVVAALPVLAVSTADFLDCLAMVSARGAVLVDASDPAGYRWGPEAEAAAARAVSVFEALGRQHGTAKARAAAERVRAELGVRKGRQPLLSGGRRAVARNLWLTSPLSAASIAKQFGVSLRTMYNEFGPRTGMPADGDARGANERQRGAAVQERAGVWVVDLPDGRSFVIPKDSDAVHRADGGLPGGLTEAENHRD
jgi:hypothetical protein